MQQNMKKVMSHITYYQIDKSSESQLVYSYVKIEIINIFDDDYAMKYIYFFNEIYMKFKLIELLEIPETFESKFDIPNLVLEFTFKTFSDNTQKILENFFLFFATTPSLEVFEYAKLAAIENLRKKKDIIFDKYVKNIFYKFKNKTTDLYDIDQMINSVNSISFMLYHALQHKILYEGIKRIYLNIAGNIYKKMVEKIHKDMKSCIHNNIRLLLEEPILQVDDSPSVVNYYQKSEMNVPQNGIIVVYEFPENYTKYIEIFRGCFQAIALNYLQFNYTNAYNPSIKIENNIFQIFEQGLYKEVDEMEDDINQVLFDVFEGKINFSNYDEILESYTTLEKAKREKTLDNLFD